MGTIHPEPIMKLHFFTSLMFSVTAISGCTISRGYDGPERPESELSRVYFYSNNGVDLKDIAVDGRTKNYFDMGIDILPGTHSVWLSYEVKEESCDYFGCVTKTYSGRCESSLKTEAGRKYAVRVSGYGESVSINAEFDEGGGYAGSGSCTTTDYDLNFQTKPNKK